MTTPTSPTDAQPVEAPIPDRRQARADADAVRKRARAETIGRYVAMFAMPLIMVGMMITGYLGTMHNPTPHHMPIVVAGSDAQAFADALTDADPDAVAMSVADSAALARQQVVDREVSGAVVVDGTTATLYTASAAGASQVSVVTSLVAPEAVASGLTLTSEDLVPLPDGDASGMGAMFLATALAMAGYLPFSVLVSYAPRLLRFRRAVPLVAAWAAVVAATVWTVTGPILGIVDGADAGAVMGIAWLGVFAIGSVQLFFTRLFGPMAVIVGMLFLMVLGMPASNMAMSVHTMPGFYQFLHGFLPTPAIGESMRSVLYFDGAGVWPHLLVLGIGSLVGLGATLAFDALKRRKNPTPPPMLVNMPSLHGGRRPTSKFWHAVPLFLFPFLMVAMMISVMLGAMHSPVPRDMPVAVVGATEEQAQQTADALDEQMPDMFVYTVLDDADEARDLVSDRTVVGAFVLPSQENPSATVITNQAGGNPAAMVVTRVFTQVAAAQNLPVAAEDVAPLPKDDSNGTVSMYVGMGWILAGFMIIVVSANAAPSSRPLRRLVPILAVYAPFMSTVIWLIADPITGAVDGHFWQLFGTGTLAIFAVAMFTTILERLLGLLAVIPVVGVMMFLGVPSSNGALSIYMEPEAFRWLHDVLPMPAAVESIRAILYFDGAGIAIHLLVLALWAIASFIVVSVIDLIKPVRTETETIKEPHFLLSRAEHEAAVAAAAPEPAAL
ncbi:ABC transporter permease [Microbacterium gorillae]|uniref:ABC transporter permease n=1 Tax=Microbacterium gorillae TaxID=1231063 RepID=UPI001E504314|nr:ABC transporter permease [Microbacterium gorillae]